MLRPGPLARRAPVRSLRGGVAGALLGAAFALLALAAAAPPMFAESAANAAVAEQLETVPATASAGSSPVVRIVGGGTQSADRADRTLSRIPGLGPGTSTVTSIGAELLTRDALFTPYVTGPRGTARARLFGQPEPESALVPQGARVTPGQAPGVWLPVPVAEEIGAKAGDVVTLGVTRRFVAATRVQATVTGLYAVGPDGRLPANPPGTRLWTERRPAVPPDTEFRTLTAHLVIADVPTVTLLAAQAKDTLMYAAEGRLDPEVPTLEQAGRTVDGILRAAARVRDPQITDERPGQIREQVVSGLPELVGEATRVAARTTGWAATMSAAGAALGLLTVLAAVLVGLQRRAVEMRHAVGSGMRPAGLGALAALEAAVLALPMAALGLLGAWVVVVAVGPPGAVTTASVADAAVRAVLAGLAGVLLAAVVTALDAARVARLVPGRSARPVPWELLLVAVALTTSAGLTTRRETPGPPGALDLLLPVFVLAAAGAVAARIAQRVADRRTSVARRPVAALAVRRVAAGGAPAVLVVAALTTGLGLLAWSLVGTASIRDVTGDRVAVRAGAAATGGIPASWLLDDDAARRPARDPDEFVQPPTNPVPGVRMPPLPDTETVVWRGQVTVPPEYGNIELIAVDPDRFAEVAAWGTGGQLREVRSLLPELARLDREVAARLRDLDRSQPVAAIGVGEVLQKPGDDASVNTGFQDVPIRVLDVVDVFPGYRGSLPTIVVPADSFLLSLGEDDPRLAPPPGTGRFDGPPQPVLPSLWSSRGEAGLREVLGPREIEPNGVTTLLRLAQDPDSVAARRSLGFQVALGGCVAAIALLVLALFADRAAARSRAADLLLARMGLGVRGALRARAAELALLTGVALLAAVAGIAALVPLGPRLLDPGGGPAPAFVLRPDPVALLVTAGAALAGLAVAVLAARIRSRAGTDGEVLRDAE